MTSPAILCAAILGLNAGERQQSPDGLYLKFSGAVVMQQDAELLSVGGVPLSASLEFDTGYGVHGAVGYTFAWGSAASLSLEFEYSFRTADVDVLSSPPLTLPATGRNESHSVMFNLFGSIDIVDGFGLYGGGGIGLAQTNSELTLDLGGGMTVSFPGDTDTTLAWQLMAGVQYAVGGHLVLYSGVRYFDAGTVEFSTFRSENKSLSLEVGLRFHF